MDVAVCEYCGPECLGGAAHFARVEDGEKYTDAVEAAAPRETCLHGKSKTQDCPTCDDPWQLKHTVAASGPETSRVSGFREEAAKYVRAEEDRGRSRYQIAVEERKRVLELEALLNTPETDDFFKGIELEAAHQRYRWPSENDAGKTQADWFWLIGYLAGKCLYAALAGDTEKALHHTISTAAALANWHRAIKGAGNMQPGIATPPEEALLGGPISESVTR